MASPVTPPLALVAPDERPGGPSTAMTGNTDDLRRQAEVVLGDQDIALLRPFGEIRATAPGDVLFDENSWASSDC